MWSEEEMREIEPEPPARRTGARRYAGDLRQTLSERNLRRAPGLSHELTRGSVPSVVYAPQSGSHGNFVDASYRRICANPEWNRRLQKAHTAKRQATRLGPEEETRAWHELDCSSSSDALLMNIFCYPRVLLRSELCDLLGVVPGSIPEFGYYPRLSLTGGLTDRTEIDMRVGGLLVEAKLTESDFQSAPVRLLDRYTQLEEVFDVASLEITRNRLRSYQLIRGVLAAHAEGTSFCLVCDERRPDLREAWFDVVRAVRSFTMHTRMRLITWQEISGTLPKPLRSFLAEKYGIERSPTTVSYIASERSL